MMVVTTLSVVLACLAVACARSPPKPSPCICTKQYDPVCGDDGKTYGNQCTLNCAASKEGVKKLKSGECPVCPIPAIFDEVCGANMKTYANKYIPKCLGIPVALNRKCPVCATPYIYRPVCGSNGYTYDNEYIAKCIEVTVAHEGPCQES